MTYSLKLKYYIGVLHRLITLVPNLNTVGSHGPKVGKN